jgi:hypothetical protein
MTARAATKANGTNIHQFVGNKVRELRGTMPPSDFAAHCGTHQAEISKWEAGGPACRYKLEFIAKKNKVDIGYFFPDGKVPDNYPRY